VSGYVEHAPPPALAPFVECFWTRGSAGPTAGNTGESSGKADASALIVPDGCVDVIVDLAGPGRAFVVGPMTRARVVENVGAHDFVAVRLRPGAAPAFFAAALDEWKDVHVELRDAWSDGGRLVDLVGGGGDPMTRRIAFARELARRMASAPERLSAATRAVALARAVREAEPETSVAALAAALGFTRQHLARVLSETAGLAPKLLQRIARMQRALDLLQNDPAAGLARIALDAGYSDQAHFTGELKALTGRTPLQWRDDAR
jgi:AraC-like DNA-binding protein